MLFWAILISVFAGVVLLGVTWLLPIENLYGERQRVTIGEFACGCVVTAFIASMVISVWGPSVSRSHAVAGYHEFWNGSMVTAVVNTTTCSYDGPCKHEYNCDKYYVKVVDRHAYTDKDGNYHSEQSHQEARYHDCPYVTAEYSFYLYDSLGRTFTIAEHWISVTPDAWTSDNGSHKHNAKEPPGDIGRGIPPRWATAKARLDAGDAEPVTKVNDYTNYILPSEGRTAAKYNSNIDKYLQEGLLPKHTVFTDDSVLFDWDTQATKVQLVGVTPVNQDVWQDRLMRFNAGLGSERQGDLHVVIVPATRVDNPDEYANSLTAYWQSNLGRWGFPKNGIALVIGVSDDASTIVWSRTKTGMPEGNGEMIAALNFGLNGKPFDADVVLGKIVATPVVIDGKNKVSYVHSTGLVDKVVFTDYPFKRACMNCKDKSDTGLGYVFLKDTIPVSLKAKVWMLIIVFAVSGVVWVSLFTCAPFKGLLPAIKREFGNSA